MDNRGLANRLIIFGAIILLTAFLTIAIGPVVSDLENQSSQYADTSEATTGLGYIESAWDFYPVIGLMLGVTMLIGGALVESRRGR